MSDPAQLKAFEAAQDQLSSALSRLMVVVERYPDLKADQQFLTLQAQLEGTENRIAVAQTRLHRGGAPVQYRDPHLPGGHLVQAALLGSGSQTHVQRQTRCR